MAPATDPAAATIALPLPNKSVALLATRSPTQLRSAFPVLGNPANKHRTVSLTAKQFHYAFGNALTEEESELLPPLASQDRKSVV